MLLALGHGIIGTWMFIFRGGVRAHRHQIAICTEAASYTHLDDCLLIGKRRRIMQIIIKSRHMQVSPSLREYIERKVQRLSRLVAPTIRLEVTVSEEPTRSADDRFVVHLAVTGNGHPIHSEMSALHASAALDLALDKIEMQLGRLKDRLTKGRRHHRTPIKTLTPPSEALSDQYDEMSTETSYQLTQREDENKDRRLTQVSLEDEPAWSRVMEIRSMPATPMTDREVIAHMEEEGSAFYPFFNDETKSVNVMYRLDSGGYGLLVPAS